MKIRVGLLGLPNVGKSTLFNALAQQPSLAQAANFPFCTIDPNIAPIPVPDSDLKRLGSFANSLKTIPATVEWRDVAGLAKGAHRGEGLGNKFLGTLRECHAICHVVRVFEDPNIIHVDGLVDPVSDAEAIHLELILADLAHVERRREAIHDKMADATERETLKQVANGLQQGIPARALGLANDQIRSIQSMGLLTLKPVLYVFNVDEVDFTLDRPATMDRMEQLLESISYCDYPRTDLFCIASAKLEADLSGLANVEAQWQYLKELGVDDDDNDPCATLENLFSCNVLPTKIRQLLNLDLVYTGPGVPPERSRTTKAHLIASTKATTVFELAGKLHGDIQKGFIRAEVTPAATLLEHASYTAAKEAGCIRTEGRDYPVVANDVVLVKWK